MILCCGEALIDMLPRETTAGEGAFAPYAGGAVFNSSVNHSNDCWTSGSVMRDVQFCWSTKPSPKS